MKRHENMLGSILPQVCTCTGFGVKCPHGTIEHTAITPQDANLARVFAKALGTPVIAPVDTSFFHRLHSALRLGAVETLRPLLDHYKHEVNCLTREQQVSLLWDALHGPFTVLPRRECSCCKPNQLIANTALGANDHLSCLRLILTATPEINHLAREFNARQSLIITAASWLVKHQLNSDQPVLPSVLRKLDKAGIDIINPGREDKDPPLHWSAMAGSFGCVAYLVKEKGVPVDLITESTPDPPLYHAYKFGHPKAFAELLKLGAKMTVINPKNGYGWAVVHGMALCRPWLGKPQESMWEMAVAHDPSVVTARDCKGRTALHRAAASGNTEAVVLLLELGWDIGAEDNEGWTPLCCAINSGRLPPVKALCERGALDREHCTPRSLGCVAMLAVLTGVHAYSQACIGQHYYYYPDLSTGEERPVNKFNWRGAYYEPCAEGIGILQALFDATPPFRNMITVDGKSVGCLALTIRLTDGSPGLLDTHAAAFLRLLQKNHCNVLTRGPADEGTVLHAAAARGYCKTIEFLIKEARANPNELSSRDPSDVTGVTSVYAAVLHNKPRAALKITELGGVPHGRRTDLTRWAIVRAAIYDTKLTIFTKLSIMDSDPLARRDASTGMSCLDAAVYVENIPVLKSILVDLKPTGDTVNLTRALNEMHPLSIWVTDTEDQAAGAAGAGDEEAVDSAVGTAWSDGLSLARRTTHKAVLANPLHIALEEKHWECALMLLEADSEVKHRGGPRHLSADGYVPEVEVHLRHAKDNAARVREQMRAAEPGFKSERRKLEKDWEELERERARLKAQREAAAAAILAAAARAAENERRKKRMLDVRKSRSPSPSSPLSPSSPMMRGRSTSTGSKSGSPSPLASPGRFSGSPTASSAASPPGSPKSKGRSPSPSLAGDVIEPPTAEEIARAKLIQAKAAAAAGDDGAGGRSGSPMSKVEALSAAKAAADAMSQDQIEFQRAVKARNERLRKGLDVVGEDEMKLLRRRERKRRRKERGVASGPEAALDDEEEDDLDVSPGGGSDSDTDSDDDVDDPRPEAALTPGVSAAGRIFRMPSGAGGGREKSAEEVRAIAKRRAEKKKRKEKEAFLLGPKTQEFNRLKALWEAITKDVVTLQNVVFLINKKADQHAAEWEKEMHKMYRRATRVDRWGRHAPTRTVFPEPPDLRRFEGTTAKDWFYHFFGEDGVRRLMLDGYVEEGYCGIYLPPPEERATSYAHDYDGEEDDDDDENDTGYPNQRQAAPVRDPLARWRINSSSAAAMSSAYGSRSARNLAPVYEHEDDSSAGPSPATPRAYEYAGKGGLEVSTLPDDLNSDAIDELLQVGVFEASKKTKAPVLPAPAYDASVAGVTSIARLPSGADTRTSPTKAAARSMMLQQHLQALAASAGAPAASTAAPAQEKPSFVKRIASAFSFKRAL